MRQQRRVLVYDTLLEKTYDDFTRVHEFEDLAARLASNKVFFRYAYRGTNMAHSMAEDFDYVCRAVLCCSELTFAVEEIGLFQNSWKMPIALQTIISTGRHRGISFFCTSQRASNIHPLIRALATDVVSFQQTEPLDLQWLRDVMGDKADSVASLPLHKCLEWNCYDVSQQTTDADETGEAYTDDDGARGAPTNGDERP